jgi:hypothetical protein
MNQYELSSVKQRIGPLKLTDNIIGEWMLILHLIINRPWSGF